jgi:hypothetical protein
MNNLIFFWMGLWCFPKHECSRHSNSKLSLQFASIYVEQLGPLFCKMLNNNKSRTMVKQIHTSDLVDTMQAGPWVQLTQTMGQGEFCGK